MEQLFCDFHELGAQIVVYIAKLSGPCHSHRFRPALDAVQARQALLQSHLTGTAGNYQFVMAETAAIPFVALERSSDTHWQSYADSEVARPFSQGRQPLCRVALLHGAGDHELIVTLHHAIADGLSGLMVVQDLLAAYRSITEGAGEPTTSTFPLTPPELLPPLEQLVGSRSSIFHKFWYVFDLVKQAIFPFQILGQPDCSVEERQTRFITCALSEAETASLVQACKQRGTTVNSALCAAMLLAAAVRLGGRGRIRVSFNTFVDLRRSVSNRDLSQTMGCLASGLQASFQLGPKSNLWELAARCQHQIHRAIGKRRPHNDLLAIDLFKIDTAFLSKLARQKSGRTATVSISNCGVRSSDRDRSDLQLREFYFISGQHLLGASIWLGATTLDGRLCASLGYADPVLSRDSVLAFQATFLDLLLERSGF